jgi:membrane-associated PAP2 superfamily phosphatase
MGLRAFVCLLTISLSGLIVSIAIHELTGLDQWVQDYLYDAPQDQWVVDKNAPIPRLIFYILPKYAVIALGVVLGVSLILDRVHGRADTFDSRQRFFLLLCLIFITLTVAIFKRYSGVFCPSDLARYGGREALRLLFQAREPGGKIGQCFPGGHASAGFALVAFSLLPRKQKHRWALLAAALLIGWAMGVYQMAKGSHFLTHTLTTMFIALVIALLLAVWLLRPGAFNRQTDGPAEPPGVS